MKDKNIFKNKAGKSIGLLGLITIAFIAGILITSTSTTPFVEKEKIIPISERNIKPIPLGVAALEADTSGLLYAHIRNHTSDPTSSNAFGYGQRNHTNTSYANCFEFYDYGNNSMTGETPFNTAFDILILYRYNQAVSYNSTSGIYEIDWVHMNITCSDLSINSPLTMEEVEIGTDGTYFYVAYYVQDSDGGAGTGFTIAQNENFNMTLEPYGYY